MAKEYYKLLGVSENASPEELKRVFRKLARETHPDANPDDPHAEARFREIAEAYEVLSDTEKRRKYDRGETDFGDLLGGFGFDDILRSVFGDGGLFGGSRTGGRRRGRDVLVSTVISLEEAAFGTSTNVEYHVSAGCAICRGSGASPGSSPRTCSQCNGQGAVQVARRTMLGNMMTVVECDQCSGSGTVVTDPCQECHGSGAMARDREVLVEVPAGVEHGTRLRLSGNGESGARGAPAGDLYVEVSVDAHADFSRSGDDLVHELPVGVAQATLGAEFEVPLIDGGTKTFKLPAGTQPSTVFAIPNEGMGRLGHRGRGRLLIDVSVTVPEQLSKDATQALRAFAEIVEEDVAASGRKKRAR